MKRDRKLERVLSIVSLSISQFMMYGIGKNEEGPTYLPWIAVLLSVTAIVCAGILE